MTVAIVDGDIVAYRTAASAEKDDQSIALIRATRLMQDIVSDTGADEIKLFLSGSQNFRYDIYPEYKANRKDLKRPQHLQAVREFLVVKWGADVTDGYEADDAIGVEATKNRDRMVVCSIDKDLLQIPGSHYNFVSKVWTNVGDSDGWRNFYQQLVLGDKADNIPGFDGKSRVKWPKFLDTYREGLVRATNPSEMYDIVKDLYTSQNQEILERNAQLLYVWRTQNDKWQPPTAPDNTSEAKPETAEKSASTATTLVVNTPSTGRTTTKPKKGGSRQRGRSTATLSTKKRRGR